MARQNSPIFVLGLPRSGTTWLASVLGTASGIKQFHEPFNKDHVPEAAQHWNRYLRIEDVDPEFDSFCQRVFAGRMTDSYTRCKLSWPYRAWGKKMSWLPGRVMVKDVHALVCLDRISTLVAPQVVIVNRHPCGLADSWVRTFPAARNSKSVKGLDRLLQQPQLIDDYLEPFTGLLSSRDDFFQSIALYWGVVNYIWQQQRRQHPDWIFVQHEELCTDPKAAYEKLFSKLNLVWTDRTNEILQNSTNRDAMQPYSPVRISSQEPEKWLSRLSGDQIDLVKKTMSIFNLPIYS
ncbi:MAG: sulfotransferase [Cyanobacteria bacterium J06560_5]